MESVSEVEKRQILHPEEEIKINVCFEHLWEVVGACSRHFLSVLGRFGRFGGHVREALGKLLEIFLDPVWKILRAILRRML